MFKPAPYQSLSKSVSNLKKLENFSWQWGYENGVVFNTASLIFNQELNKTLLRKFLHKKINRIHTII